MVRRLPAVRGTNEKETGHGQDGRISVTSLLRNRGKRFWLGNDLAGGFL